MKRPRESEDRKPPKWPQTGIRYAWRAGFWIVAAWLLGLGVLRILDSVTGAHLAPYWLGAFPVLVLILITNLTRSRGGSRQNEKEPPR